MVECRADEPISEPLVDDAGVLGVVYHGIVKVFISHAEKDRPFAVSLGRALARAGVSVWEPQSVQPGENWALKAGQALAGADAVVVLLSPDSAASEAVQREIEFAISSPQFKGRLIPILVRPTRKVPWILQELPQWLDVRDTVGAAKGVLNQLRPRRTRRRPVPRDRRTATRANQ